MKWLLDADVLSQPAKRNGNAEVIAWLERERSDCCTSAVVMAQLAYWVRTKEGRQRLALQKWLTAFSQAMQGRILSFNVATAHVWAEQRRLLEQAGKTMPVEDSYIAAAARRYSLTIVTGNDKDFRGPGLKVFNPFKETSDRPGRADRNQPVVSRATARQPALGCPKGERSEATER
jgi:predicted nucleic acid-binding protein